jgi:hypothetical protein
MRSERTRYMLACLPALSAPTWRPLSQAVQAVLLEESEQVFNESFCVSIAWTDCHAAPDKRRQETQHRALVDPRQPTPAVGIQQDYKVAIEKCDAPTGDAKGSCVAAARAKFGKT